MSAQEQGRQSPPLEEQSGTQGLEPTSSGQGVDDGTNSKEDSKAQLEGLSSNPKGPLDDHVAQTTSKTVENKQGEVKF